MTHARKERRRRHARLMQAALDRLPEDIAWSARRQADYELAIRLTATTHLDRLVEVANLPAIDWGTAHDSMLAANAGLRLV